MTRENDDALGYGLLERAIWAPYPEPRFQTYSETQPNSYQTGDVFNFYPGLKLPLQPRGSFMVYEVALVSISLSKPQCPSTGLFYPRSIIIQSLVAEDISTQQLGDS